MCIWKLNQFTRKVQTFLKRNIANYSYKLDFSSKNGPKSRPIG